MLEKGVHIPSIDGKDIYISNHYLNNRLNDYGVPIGYRLRNANGDLNLKKFINTLDYSLDLIKLWEVYESVYRRRDFSFNKNGKEYTQRIINVTFKYNNKLYNRIRNNLYVHFGYAVEDLSFQDHVAIKNGVLLGIEVDTDIIHPVSNDILGKYFYFQNGQYKAKNNIPILNSVANIREEIYKNGFVCDGIKYIRFKRSSGSSRVGKCLFIDEKLYKQMHRWEMCGIKVRKGQKIDLAALEPYIALTLSSIIDVIDLEKENFLIIDDYESIFKDRAIATRLVDGRLVSKPEDVEIHNSIWDGQSLMDRSVFKNFYEKEKSKNSEVREHGMLLLRGRFFKSCCFNSNIQKWFHDNGITDIRQLNGITMATDIKQIKIITTTSSIKYVKFGDLHDWLNTLDRRFGVVKYEKPTHFFDGRMVHTHYQLINTLQLSYEEVEHLVQPSIDFARMMKTDPAVLRFAISYEYHSPDDYYYNSAITSKNEIIYKMLGINNTFAETKLYQQFRDEQVKSFIKNLRCGHILVHGNYSTMCGNPVEMLKYSIGNFDGTSSMQINTVHSINFDDGKELLGSRSPHVTIGNVLLTKNVIYDEIKKYMNPTPEIVYVNSINENLLERLSGSDFDSDTVLLTDNEILITAAKRNYHNFPVPTKLVESTKRDRRYTDEEKADLDIKTSVNKIGEIINLSQELNSILWDRLYHGASIDDIMELYCDISQLDVMSNLEIDSAKRENPANNTLELQCLKKKYDVRDKKNRHIRPLFFKYIDGYKGYRDGYYIYQEMDDETFVKQRVFEKSKDAQEYKQSKDGIIVERGRMSYQKHETAMDYLERCVNKFRTYRKKEQKRFSEILVPIDEISGSVWYPQVHRIIDVVRETRNSISVIWSSDNGLSKRKRRNMAEEILNEAINYVKESKIGEKSMRYLISLIDSKKYSDISRFLFNILFATANEEFYRLIIKSKDKIDVISEDIEGELQIFDYHYKRIFL